jgi:hypothetical protein
MRHDMGRVVIERPRKDSDAPTLKARKTGKLHLEGDWEEWDYDGPERVPNSAPRMKAISHKLPEKSFTDVLGPIEGYLRKHIGKPWDAVYAELAANLGGYSWPVRHVLTQHVDVEVNTYLGVDGKIYAENDRGNLCVSEPWWGRRTRFYVHPLTRRLCAAAHKRQRYRRELTKWDTDCRKVGDNWFVSIAGIWYIGYFRPRQFDHEPRNFPHTDRYTFVKVKQANKRESRAIIR